MVVAALHARIRGRKGGGGCEQNEATTPCTAAFPGRTSWASGEPSGATTTASFWRREYQINISRALKFFIATPAIVANELVAEHRGLGTQIAASKPYAGVLEHVVGVLVPILK